MCLIFFYTNIYINIINYININIIFIFYNSSKLFFIYYISIIYNSKNINPFFKKRNNFLKIGSNDF